jgi:S1-C subfamily serine protease
VAEAASYTLAAVLELSNRAKAPDFIPSPIPDVGLVLHLITSAESDAAGLAADESGLKVTGVVAGLPAAEAGLREGDLILELAKRRFRRDDTIAALMAMHRQVLEGKFGFSLPVKFIRDKKQSESVITLRR